MTTLRALVFCTCFLTSLGIHAQDSWPQTRAERTDYKETSHYSGVIEFIEALQAKGAPVSIKYIGTSKEGKRMPLVIAARPMVASPTDARRSGKPIIYIQANIHAGEVEGKEAALALLRRVSQEKAGVLDKVILLVNPIYNIDGNEKFGPQERNRPEQDGPPSVGQRASGEGLDLNRDGIKAESLEMRAALAHIYTTWDPDVMMDLHTTDGTRHGYDLTYSPPGHPNTDAAILKFTRDQMLPSVRSELKSKHALETFDYGDVTTRIKPRAWTTFGEGGRYLTNYLGLRNRIAVLSEAATYIPFKDRVVATDRFVSAVIEYVARHASEVIALTRDADASNRPMPNAMGVRFEMASRGVESVLVERQPAAGKPRLTGRPIDLERLTMPIYDRFKASKTAEVPAAYLIPAAEVKVIELLRRHGIVVEKFVRSWSGAASKFTMSEVRIAPQPFQGHKLIELDGSFSTIESHATPGDFFVRINQPLRALVFTMLEPENIDGVAAWGYLAKDPVKGGAYPLIKLKGPVTAVSETIP